MIFAGRIGEWAAQSTESRPVMVANSNGNGRQYTSRLACSLPSDDSTQLVIFYVTTPRAFDRECRNADKWLSWERKESV